MAIGLSVLIGLGILLAMVFFLAIQFHLHVGQIASLLLAFDVIYGMRYINPIFSIMNLIMGVFLLRNRSNSIKRLAIITGAIGIIASLVLWRIQFVI